MLRGYSTLIGVVLLLAFLTVIMFGIHSMNLSNLQSAYERTSSSEALTMSESCVEEVMRRLKNSLGYSGGNIPLSDSTSCTATVTGDNTQKIINVSTSNQNFQKNIQATIDITIEGSAINFNLVNWQEL